MKTLPAFCTAMDNELNVEFPDDTIIACETFILMVSHATHPNPPLT